MRKADKRLYAGPDAINTKARSGFTLIELVVVITILGILAATALPRFVDISNDARVAKLRAARGTVLSAASIANSASFGKQLNANDSVQMAGALEALLICQIHW